MIAYPHLPVTAVLPQVTAALCRGSAILSAPTGSGKTTLVPLTLLDEPWLKGRKIIMLEPRRLAARTAAARMSEILGEPLGQTVGYRIRFDNKISSRTKIEVVTEGILTRMVQNDPELSGVGLVIFDEFHERSLHADLGLSLCLDLQQLRDDLRLLVMSATLETLPLAKLMGEAPVITGKGRAFPVNVYFLPPSYPDHMIARNMVRGIEYAWREASGDILAFLPGTGEIRATVEMLSDSIPTADILPLYGELSHTEQDHALRPGKHRNRRIIVATPIAETSITIEGIGCVVDSGFARRPRFNPATGLNKLETVRISKASAEQRRGRAGRLGPGCCFRLWSKEIDQGLLPSTPPEITTSDITPVVLELALWGVTRPEQMKWLDMPRPGPWGNARHLLADLGAVDAGGHITATGRRLASLPTHPRLGSMLLAAEQTNLGTTACLLAALLSERDVIKGRTRGCDLRERLQVLLDSKSTYQVPESVDFNLSQRILEQAAQLRKLMNIRASEPVQPEACGLLLTSAYPDRLAVLRPGTRTSYQLVTGRGAVLPDDHLAGTPILAIARLDESSGNARILSAAPIDVDMLRSSRPHMFTTHPKIWWDDSAGRVRAVSEYLLGRAVLSQNPLKAPNQEVVLDIFLANIKEKGLSLLPWTDESRQIQARAGFLRLQEGEIWPDISDQVLKTDLGWLAPYCTGMSALSDLKRLDMKNILQALFPWDLLRRLEEETPTQISVPSGSKKRLIYSPDKPPILAVRLQEMFGLYSTPTICRGKVHVTLHLLSPANRPIQVTSNLESFWQTTYSEVRKDLAGRYPKHYWPEDPHLATPTTHTKKGMQRHNATLSDRSFSNKR